MWKGMVIMPLIHRTTVLVFLPIHHCFHHQEV
jgi:hypothetical protein